MNLRTVVITILAAAIIQVQASAGEIHRAVSNGDIKKVGELLDADLSLVYDREEGLNNFTPLHLAARYGYESIMELLLDRGADIDAYSSSGETPLFLAVRKGQEGAASLLLQRGAGVNRRIQGGMTPLYVAAAAGRPGMVEILLAAGAITGSGNRLGLTPLHVAAAFGFGPVVEALVLAGADMRMKAVDNSSPVHMAAAGENDDIVAFFRMNGAGLGGINYPVYSGPYLGSVRPGKRHELFLPGVVLNLYRPHGTITVSPDGREIYWTRTSPNFALYEKIWFMKEENGRWTPPRVAPFSVDHNSNFPAFSPDGKRLFFSSDRPVSDADSTRNLDIWYVERRGGGWSLPVNAGVLEGAEGSEAEHPSLSSDGTLYYHIIKRSEQGFEADICSSLPSGRKYSLPRRLSASVNTPHVEAGPCVSPGGRYMIFSSNRPAEIGGLGIYISFRTDDGSWSEALPAGEIAPGGMSQCAGVSADGRYIFFTGSRDGVWDYYWIDAEVAIDMER